ncbi:hypothetical protein AAFX91_35065 [Bradyrhizobium sp. 31Argb]|uniref:hypothetical protein n=1 Tax=unclassified Bradyrhizobium TaxID=2631580 RepID=UPI0013EE8DF2|nr:hypothetical protein [Bradyrhizobium sp. Leo170]
MLSGKLGECIAHARGQPDDKLIGPLPGRVLLTVFFLAIRNLSIAQCDIALANLLR